MVGNSQRGCARSAAGRIPLSSATGCTRRVPACDRGCFQLSRGHNNRAGARDADEIEPVLKAFAREPNGGLIVAPSPITTFRRELIITLARQLDLPAIYPFRY